VSEGEYGSPDIPLTATRDSVAEGAPWRTSAAQDGVLGTLRDLSRAATGSAPSAPT